jgi:hypothetical protein
MTREELQRLYPNASEAFIRRNADPETGVAALRPTDAQPDEGKPLVRRRPRKETSGESTAGRLRIRFTVYAVRPADWDGYDIKHLQDMLVRAEMLPDDNWRILSGEVRSEKVHSKEEEKTVVEITPCQPQ